MQLIGLRLGLTKKNVSFVAFVPLKRRTGSKPVFLKSYFVPFSEKISMAYPRLFEKCTSGVATSLVSFGLMMTVGTTGLSAQDYSSENIGKGGAQSYSLGSESTASPQFDGPDGKGGLWSFSLGGGVMTTPEFEGSDRNDGRFLPIAEVMYNNRFFLSTRNGLGAYIVNKPDWQLGVSANYNPGRDESDSHLLRGLGDIDPGVDFGGFATWKPMPFIFGLSASQGVGDVEGFRANATAGMAFQPLKAVTWKNSVETTYANSTYNDTFFGISQQQSLRSQYQTYDAGGGIKDVAFNSNINWDINGSFALKTFGQYKRLTGPAADSPLVKAGSANQWTAGVAIVYGFGG